MLRSPARLLVAIPLLYFLYFFGLTSVGLVSTDEPRYAAVSREMARSGDWITPRLWGQAWFEKPALIYWMEGGAFRLGLSDDLAPRLPIALGSVAFLVFFYWVMRREFGDPAAGLATAILGTSAAWLSFSHVGLPDLPMSAAFAAAMLLSLGWLNRGERQWLPLAAALLGLAVLAKGLVPFVLALPLALPLAWMGRRRLLDWFHPRVMGAFVVVALPWYVLCFLRNGWPFLQTFFWQHQIERFRTPELAHSQPFWFFVPVIVGALFPWSPFLAILARRSLYTDVRCRFLLVWALFGLVFFSAARNKLPGYVLPLVPALASLAGIALAEQKRARWVLVATAAMLVFMGPIAAILPDALAAGISRSLPPAFHWTWLLPAFVCPVVWYLDAAGQRGAAVALLALCITAGALAIELRTFPELDRVASARPLWQTVAPIRDRVCVARLHRSLRYGLNYYSVVPLPDCREEPREVEINQEPGEAPRLIRGVAVPASVLE